jgi:hypothetical protein
MIDSEIWKEKLEQDVRTLRKRLTQRRWSYRSMVLFERELTLIFFSIRALIEAGKLTNRTSYREYKYLTFPNKGKIVDDYTKYDIHKAFDLDAGIEKNLTLKILTHQFVHAYVISPEISAEGRVIGVLLCSDWDKTNVLIQLQTSLANEIIENVIADEIESVHLIRNRKTGELRKVKIL